MKYYGTAVQKPERTVGKSAEISSFKSTYLDSLICFDFKAADEFCPVSSADAQGVDTRRLSRAQFRRCGCGTETAVQLRIVIMNTRAELLAETDHNVPVAGPDWTGITGFLAMILRSVESVDWFGRRGHFVCGGGYHAQESLMRLLTYCAVTGSQTLEEIAAKLHTDRAAKLLHPGEMPDAATLLRFAEVQPGALRRCVAEFWHLSSFFHLGQHPPQSTPADDFTAVRFDHCLELVPAPDAEPEGLLVLNESSARMP
jgi:hypothetical protein